jgi:ABC-2 type transport system ATP-binding protein
MSDVLRLKSVSKSYGELAAVSEVSLSLGRGECLAILGPNGAGKTTLLEMIEGLQTPDAGQIEIFGADFGMQRRSTLKRIAAVMQETNLYKRMTIRETWELFASFYPSSIPIAELAVDLGIDHKLDAQLRSLSGGEKQRAYIGCALIGRPEIILLDEPTTGLDPNARRQIWSIIRQMRSRDISIILTTHYMEEAESLANRVVIMHRGKIIESGEPADLIRTNCGSDVVEVVTASDVSQIQVITEKFGRRCRLDSEAGSIDFYCESSEAAMKTAQLIGEFAKSKSIVVKSIQMRRASLEDVFLSKTGKPLHVD